MGQTIDVALLGFGAVGRALARRVQDEGCSVRIVAACDSEATVEAPGGLEPAALLGAKRKHGSLAALDAATSGSDPVDLAGRVEADVVVQLTPTRLDEPETNLQAIEAALSTGKHVVAAGKDALACHPDQLQALAQQSEGVLRASAAVGGSVPIIETLERSFEGDRVHRVQALLNGSTTFVLARMEQGASREEALTDARARGLLEADPTLDLSGQDAAAKAAILHQHLYGSACSIEDVEVEGVGRVTETACREAAQRGFAIRLLARVDEEEVRVGPVEIPQESPFAVDGPKSVVRFEAEGAGSIELAGPGAGPRETASAVLGDILEVARGPAAAGDSGEASDRARAVTT